MHFFYISNIFQRDDVCIQRIQCIQCIRVHVSHLWTTHTHNWLVVWNILKIWKSVGKDYPFFSMENKIHVWNTTNQIMNKTTTASLMTTSSQFFNPKLGKYHSEFKIQSKKHSKLCLDPDPCIQHVFETARQLVASFPFVISFQR